MCLCMFFAGFSAGFKRRTSTFCWPRWSSVTACECGGKRTVVGFSLCLKFCRQNFFCGRKSSAACAPWGYEPKAKKPFVRVCAVSPSFFTWGIHRLWETVSIFSGMCDCKVVGHGRLEQRPAPTTEARAFEGESLGREDVLEKKSQEGPRAQVE